MIKEKDLENPNKEKEVEATSRLKQLILNYVGEVIQPKDDNITVDMLLTVFTKEFPEFLLVIAEENFLRGYAQAFEDDKAMKKPEKEEKEEDST